MEPMTMMVAGSVGASGLRYNAPRIKGLEGLAAPIAAAIEAKNRG